MISNEERKANLKRLINNTGQSVAEFCRENDLDPSYISQLLNGHRNIFLSRLCGGEQTIGYCIALAALFGLIHKMFV